MASSDEGGADDQERLDQERRRYFLIEQLRQWKVPEGIERITGELRELARRRFEKGQATCRLTHR